MKKYFYVFMALSMTSFIFVSCEKDKTVEDPTETTKPTDPTDPTDPSLTDYKETYKNAEPGIYMNGNRLLAKGTDGSIHSIEDVTSLQTPQAAGGKPCIPNNWHAYDGKSSTFFFWMDYYNDNDGNWQTFTYEDTVFYSVETKWNDAQLEMALDGYAGRTDFMFFKDYKKVEDAGNFEETYIKIAKRVQALGPIVPPSKMVQQYTENGFGKWRDDLYPADMEAKKYVFKYTGSGTITSFEVSHVFGWGASAKDPKVLWLPASCDVDNIAYVNAVINDVSEEDAKAFIDNVRKNGFYTRVSSDAEADGIIVFGADSWNYDESHDLSGYNGYVYPSYEISYIDGILRINFTVPKTGFV